MSTLITRSGARRALPADFYGDPRERVAGLDAEGRIVVDDFGARAATPRAGRHGPPFLFGLTLCCNASDKGVEDGVVCRGCYDSSEIGAYLYRDKAGAFPGLDPTDRIEADR